MKTLNAVAFILAALLSLAVVSSAQQPAAEAQASLSITATNPVTSATGRKLRILKLHGSAYERGLQYGRELRADIARIIALWNEDMRSNFKKDPDEFLRRFLAETNFAPAIKKWTPDLWEEVRGIAEGSGQPFETIYAFQLMDELWVFADLPQANHCSALGVTKGGGHPAYVAQNMDLEAFRDGFQVVLHITGDATTPEQFVFSSAGLIGLNGMNRNSIAIACNTLMQLSGASEGLPVAFVVRGVLAQTSGDAALAFVHNVRHASGQNYTIGAGDRVFDFEASARKVVPWRPVADGSVVFHTNHPLANDDWKVWHRALRDAVPPKMRDTDNSAVRLASLKTRLAHPAAEIDADAIREILRAKDSKEYPVCRAITSASGDFTFGATIMTLSERPSFSVTMGPPDVNPFVQLEFSTGNKP